MICMWWGPWVASLSSQPGPGHFPLHSHKGGIGWWVTGLQCHHVPNPSLGLLRVSLTEPLQIPLDTAAQPNLNATGTRLLIPLHALSHGPGRANSACSHARHQ